MPPAGFGRTWYFIVEFVVDTIVGVVDLLYGIGVVGDLPLPRPRGRGGEVSGVGCGGASGGLGDGGSGVVVKSCSTKVSR